MKSYKIWDSVAKEYISQPFKTIRGAEIAKGIALKAGDYPDRPHTVYQIHEFIDGKFSQEII